MHTDHGACNDGSKLEKLALKIDFPMFTLAVLDWHGSSNNMVFLLTKISTIGGTLFHFIGKHRTFEYVTDSILLHVKIKLCKIACI